MRGSDGRTRSRIRTGGTIAPLPVLVAAAVFVVVLAADAVACPNCKDAVNTADPDGLNLARGYFYSILIMLAMPLTLVSSFGVYVWREMRRQERLAASSGPVAQAVPRALQAVPAGVAAPSAPRP